MVEFETIEKERTDYGVGDENFIEVSRNKVIKDDGSESTFIQIATGYYTDGGEQYKKRFTVPKSDTAVEHIMENLPDIVEKEKAAEE